MSKWQKWWKARRGRPKHSDNEASRRQTKATSSESPYFQQAKSWADDQYSALVVSRNRYRWFCWGLIGLLVLCVLSITVMVPLQKTQLIIVHQGENNEIWLTTTRRAERPALNWSRTQAEISHYVSMRWEYYPMLYQYQTEAVKVMSSAQIIRDYENEQSPQNPQSPINQLQADGYRTVTIRSVLSLSQATPAKNGKAAKPNVAQVNYDVTNHQRGQTGVSTRPYTAIISWQYHGIPDTPDTR